MLSLLECRKGITDVRDGLTLLLRKYGQTNDGNGKLLLGLLKHLTSLKVKLSSILKLLPKARLYVEDYRLLAKGINMLRAKKVLQGSPELIVNCCLFICNFTEPDFSKSKFTRLIVQFDLEDAIDIVNKDIK